MCEQWAARMATRQGFLIQNLQQIPKKLSEQFRIDVSIDKVIPRIPTLHARNIYGLLVLLYGNTV